MSVKLKIANTLHACTTLSLKSTACSRDMYLESRAFLSVNEDVMRYACGEEKGDELEEQLTYTEMKAPSSSSILLSIEVHVVFDHTYNVCCPFIRVSGIICIFHI